MMGFLKFMFYLAMAIPIMSELQSIFQPRKVTEMVGRVRNMKDLSAKEKVDALKEDKDLMSMVYVQLFYMTWLFVGFFSSLNWPVFLFLFLISFIPKRYALLRFADGVISFCLLIFALINAVHLHINMFSVIKGWW